MFSSEDICHNFVKVTYWFPRISTSKKAILAVCWSLDETIDLHKVNSKAPFEGNIGPGDSSLQDLLKVLKILRMHAIFHDAHGYMRTENSIGPGYVYTLTDKMLFRNKMLLGHFSGILYWTFVKFFNSEYFEKFRF